MMKRIIYIALLSAVFLLPGCGYKFSGSGKYLPGDLKTVMIPDFENKTTKAEAEQFVTFAIRDEFIKRSSMKLVDSIDAADALLEGEILKFQVRPLSYSYLGSANQYTVSIVLSVALINLKNNATVYENKNMTYTEDYEIESGDFFSQETEALQKISETFARAIVSALLENY
jgi:outer membrane lipopolysaccharide assembly protein LptE/RlpB